MRFPNPTRIRIGMHGNFAGKNFRVLGRTVLGETENGETYYWNEFNLQADDGSFADLVYEETENGVQWRLFTMFEPEYELTAADAATKGVGDRLNLTGEDVQITFRGRSRVYEIEGTAPEGVAIGSVAEYFNAEAGIIMQVVSWTGDQVEYYSGINLTSGAINAAFKLQMTGSSLGSGSTFSGDYGSDNNVSYVKFVGYIAIAVILFVAIFGRNFSCLGSRAAAPLQKIPATEAPLAVGDTGKLFGKDYRVTAADEVEIDESSRIFYWHEYQLTDDNGDTADLICGLSPDDKNWELFTPVELLPAPRAVDCATNKIGDVVDVDGIRETVTELFYASTRPPGGVQIGGIDKPSRFGYIARSDSAPMLARWNDSSFSMVSLEQGLTVSAENGKAAFAKK